MRTQMVFKDPVFWLVTFLLCSHLDIELWSVRKGKDHFLAA